MLISGLGEVTLETLRGIVERITFYNEENGYTVARLAPEQGSDRVTMVGNTLGINVGEAVEATGQWRNHPRFGRQFQVERIEITMPATLVGIEKYLGSGLIKGVGSKMARRIVRKFGLQTIDVIEEQPQRLLEVLGIGRKRLAMVRAAWEAHRQIKEVMIFLQAHGVSSGLAVKIYKAYGKHSIEMVQNDPYRLAHEVYGIGFITADKIAQGIGIPEDAPERLAAALAYVLSLQANQGHTYLPRPLLLQEAANLLRLPLEKIEPALELLADKGDIRREILPSTLGKARAAGIAEEEAIYLMPFYYGEVGVSHRLRRLVQVAREQAAASPFRTFQGEDWSVAFSAWEERSGVHLSREQRLAVYTALHEPVTVLTGGPGTGKTTTVRTLIGFLEQKGLRYALASPTGRAAKRLSETARRPASTIHRLLAFSPQNGSFQRNEENPLPLEMLVVDEASMLDLLLTNSLLKAVPPGAHLLLVGDIDQLPSVGAGNVLQDVIDSGLAAVIRLETIFRQAEGSYIVVNAHRINEGKLPIVDPKVSHDFYLFNVPTPEEAATMVVDLVKRRIPQRFGLHPRDIQVLSPMHRGIAGVSALNVALQEALNPPAPAKPEWQSSGRLFRLGDRVMQIQNDYDKNVYNGDWGEIVALDLVNQRLKVRIDDRVIPYDALDLDALVHAYAISIHKAQGSEYPAVVIPLLTSHYLMLRRNLLYTAVSRARKLVVIVGSYRALRIAVSNQQTGQRFSGLVGRLREGLSAGQKVTIGDKKTV